jgi:threonine/homoserine/homoserine lactone efflux protein
MFSGVTVLLGQVVAISVSGVMAPGPVTAATIGLGARSRHAGALVAIGHACIEMPLMVAIVLGAGAFLTARWFQIGAGMAGGASLLCMGAMVLWGIRQGDDTTASVPSATSGPLWTGVVLTLANPYFFIWWATVGLALAVQAATHGALVFALYAIVHWLCDLVWLEILSYASHGGTKLMGATVRRVLLGLCGVTMVGFGAWFIVDVIRKQLGAT